MRLCFWEVLKDRKRRESTEQGWVSSGVVMDRFKWYRLSGCQQGEPRKGGRAAPCCCSCSTMDKELPLCDIVVPSKPGKGPKRGKQTRAKELSVFGVT